MDNTCSRSFTNDDTYHNSDWRAGQLTALDAFSAHQKERAELLSWVQDASDIIAADPNPYYFWPFFGCGLGFQITKPQMAQMFPTENNTLKQRRELIRRLFNQYSGTFKINNAEKTAQFFAQIKAEVGIDLAGKEENLIYSIPALRDTRTFRRYFGTYPEEASSLGYIRISKQQFQQLELSVQDSIKHTRHNYYGVISYYSQSADQEGIARRVYSCSLDSNADGGFVLIQGGDQSGIDYKGKGFIQLTWKKNYKHVQDVLEKKLGVSLGFNILDNPNSLLDTRIGFLSALGFWEWKSLNSRCGPDVTNTESITRIVNSHTDNDSKQRRKDNFVSIYNILLN